jgi:hypothetical protein
MRFLLKLAFAAVSCQAYFIQHNKTGHYVSNDQFYGLQLSNTSAHATDFDLALFPSIQSYRVLGCHRIGGIRGGANFETTAVKSIEECSRVAGQYRAKYFLILKNNKVCMHGNELDQDIEPVDPKKGYCKYHGAVVFEKAYIKDNAYKDLKTGNHVSFNHSVPTNYLFIAHVQQNGKGEIPPCHGQKRQYHQRCVWRVV